MKEFLLESLLSPKNANRIESCPTCSESTSRAARGPGWFWLANVTASEMIEMLMRVTVGSREPTKQHAHACALRFHHTPDGLLQLLNLKDTWQFNGRPLLIDAIRESVEPEFLPVLIDLLPNPLRFTRTFSEELGLAAVSALAFQYAETAGRHLRSIAKDDDALGAEARRSLARRGDPEDLRVLMSLAGDSNQSIAEDVLNLLRFGMNSTSQHCQRPQALARVIDTLETKAIWESGFPNERYIPNGTLIILDFLFFCPAWLQPALDWPELVSQWEPNRPILEVVLGKKLSHLLEIPYNWSTNNQQRDLWDIVDVMQRQGDHLDIAAIRRHFVENRRYSSLPSNPSIFLEETTSDRLRRGWSEQVARRNEWPPFEDVLANFHAVIKRIFPGGELEL